MEEREQQEKTTKTVTINNIDYLINLDEKTADIISSHTTKDEIVVIPYSIKYESSEYIVKRVLKEAFAHSQIKSIQFPEDSQVSIIGYASFVSSTIENFTAPPQLKIIGSNAFLFCRYLTNIIIPHNSQLQTIQKHAFCNSSIESLNIPESLINLEEEWCSTTSELKKITVSPKNRRYSCIDEDILIGKSTIEEDNYDTLLFCNRYIETVTIPSFIKYINKLAFNDCLHIKSFSIPIDSKLLLIDDNAFHNSSIVSFTIPQHLQIIGESAFTYCQNLVEIKVPENSELHTICRLAFFQSSIESLTIPASLCNLEKEWCAYTSNLVDVKVHPNNHRYKMYNNDLIIGKSSTEDDAIYDTIVFCNRDIKTIEIPSFIKIIESNAFNLCFSLTNVVFPEDSQIQVIEYLAFGSTAIERFIAPSHLKIIDDSAFNECERLQRFQIPSNSELKIIGPNAFYETAIENFTIPSSITEIGSFAFANCFNLIIVEIDEKSLLQSLSNLIFSGCDNVIIMIPSNLKSIKID